MAYKPKTLTGALRKSCGDGRKLTNTSVIERVIGKKRKKRNKTISKTFT